MRKRGLGIAELQQLDRSDLERIALHVPTDIHAKVVFLVEPGQKANECAEAIQRGNVSGEAEWAGKTGSATVQNCQDYQYYHRKRASAICV